MSTALIAPALFWLAAGFKLRRISEPSQRALAFAFAAFAMALTTDIPAVYGDLDRTLGIPNLANLIEHVLAVSGVFLLLVALRQIGNRPAIVAWQVWTLAVVVSVLIVSFAFAHAVIETPDLTDIYDHVIAVRIYWIATVGYFALSLTELQRLTTRHARFSTRPEVRQGFRAVGVGVWIGVVYSGLKIAEVVFGTDSLLVRTAAETALVMGSVLIGLGFAYPLVIASGRRALRSLLARRLLVQLRASWNAAARANPAIILGDPPTVWADIFGRDPGFKLYRRVIEIRDGLLAGTVQLHGATAVRLELAACISHQSTAVSKPINTPRWAGGGRRAD